MHARSASAAVLPARHAEDGETYDTSWAWCETGWPYPYKTPRVGRIAPHSPTTSACFPRSSHWLQSARTSGWSHYRSSLSDRFSALAPPASRVRWYPTAPTLRSVPDAPEINALPGSFASGFATVPPLASI